MKYMTEKRRIEEAYRSVNEYVDRHPYGFDHAVVNGLRVTNEVRRTIAAKLFKIAGKVVKEGLLYWNSARNAGVVVEFEVDGTEVVPGMDEDMDRLLEEAFAKEWEPGDEERLDAERQLAGSIGENGFRILPDDVIAVMPGMFSAKMKVGPEGWEVGVRFTVTRQIRIRELMYSTIHRKRDRWASGFRKPNLPESTVSEASDGPDAFREAAEIASDLSDAADAGDAEGVVRCFEGLRGVVDRLIR